MGRQTPLVYLAGPITGLTYGEASGWRLHVKDQLEMGGHIGVIDPLSGQPSWEGTHPPGQVDSTMLTDRGIVTKDKFFVRRCSLVLANLTWATKLGESSPGTMIEFGWADAWGIPIVAAMDDINPHNKGMVRGTVNWMVDDLDIAIEIARNLLHQI